MVSKKIAYSFESRYKLYIPKMQNYGISKINKKCVSNSGFCCCEKFSWPNGSRISPTLPGDSARIDAEAIE